jgi:hypothetical protein
MTGDSIGRMLKELESEKDIDSPYIMEKEQIQSCVKEGRMIFTNALQMIEQLWGKNIKNPKIRSAKAMSEEESV